MPNNVEIVNAIRSLGGSDYTDRIPEATRTNIAQIGLAITTDAFEKKNNEFLDALINRIGKVMIDSRLLTNRLAAFKRGTVAYGDTIEDIYVDIIKSEAYDAVGTPDQFQKFKPNVKTYFHRRNRQDDYPVTIQYESLRAAFTQENGLQRLVDGIMQSVYSSANVDEYILMKQLFALYLNTPVTPLKPGQIVTLSADITDRATADEFLVALKSAIYKVVFPSSLYNPSGVTTQSDMTESTARLALFVRADKVPVMDVYSLSAAFNMGKATPEVPIIVLDDFGEGNDDVVAALVDRDWFLVHDSLTTMTSAFNARGLYWNYFYHVWQYMAVSQFKNAIFFKLP